MNSTVIESIKHNILYIISGIILILLSTTLWVYLERKNSSEKKVLQTSLEQKNTIATTTNDPKDKESNSDQALNTSSSAQFFVENSSPYIEKTKTFELWQFVKEGGNEYRLHTIDLQNPKDVNIKKFHLLKKVMTYDAQVTIQDNNFQFNSFTGSFFLKTPKGLDDCEGGFGCSFSGTSTIYTINRNTLIPIKVLEINSEIEWWRISSNGSKLLFLEKDEHGYHSLYSLDIKSKKVDKSSFKIEASWALSNNLYSAYSISDDGLFFYQIIKEAVKNKNSTSEATLYSVLKVRVDSGDISKISFSANNIDAYGIDPVFSPNNRYVSYYSGDTVNKSLLNIFDTKNDVTKTIPLDGRISFSRSIWSPDATKLLIILFGGKEGVQDLQVLNIKDFSLLDLGESDKGSRPIDFLSSSTLFFEKVSANNNNGYNSSYFFYDVYTKKSSDTQTYYNSNEQLSLFGFGAY